MNETLVIEEALSPDLTDLLKEHLCNTEYVPVPLGEGVEMCATEAPQEVREALLSIINYQLNKKVDELAIFCRFNSENVDTSFRIHSDGEILGEQPTIAAVLYVNSGPTGTALFSHSTHGDHPKEGEQNVYVEDDHEWHVTDYCEQKENTLFIYDARKFHSRWPPEANGPRFVVVGFFKEVGIG